MVKRTRFSEYKDSYEHYQFELSPEGVLFMQCHTNGGPLEWYWESHDRMADAFADIAGDREIKVVIHTGTGDTYNALWGKPVTADQKPLYMAYDDAEGVSIMDEKSWYGRMIIENLLAIDVPMIAAVNGPCTMHSEVPLLMDIVLASEDAYFQDLSHFPRGMVPGDGQHVVWDQLVGPGRARALLLTGYKLSAQEAREWGVVWEVLPKDKLVDHAWEIARDLAMRPPIALRNTRHLFTQNLKRAFLNELDHGLQAEMWAQRQFFPFDFLRNRCVRHDPVSGRGRAESARSAGAADGRTAGRAAEPRSRLLRRLPARHLDQTAGGQFRHRRHRLPLHGAGRRRPDPHLHPDGRRGRAVRRHGAVHRTPAHVRQYRRRHLSTFRHPGDPPGGRRRHARSPTSCCSTTRWR